MLSFILFYALQLLLPISYVPPITMACPQDGGDSLHTWRVAVNILNKQSQIASQQGVVLPLGVGQGAKNSST
jgi:hypothetical protein